MTRRNLLLLVLCGLLLMTMTLPGVYALWNYAENPASSVADNMSIESLNEPEMVYILDVKVVTSNNVQRTPLVTEKSFVSYQHGDYALNQQRNNTAGGSVTIEVTVKNHSGVQQ